MADQKGQSVVEMIVVVGIVILLATGIVAGTTVSLNRAQISQVRSKALSVAQGGIELARGIRDTGWVAFTVLGTPQTTYCVGSAGTFSPGACSAPNIDNTFTRSVTLRLMTVSGVSTVKVTSTVTWADVTKPTNTIQLTTYLTQWR